MPEAWLRKLLLAAITSALVAAIVRAMQGDPAPQFSGAGAAGRGSPDRPVLVPAPTDTTVTPVPVVEQRPSTAAPSTASQPTLDLRLVPDPDAPTPASEVDAAWVEPVDDDCPPGFPVKAKLSSGIFHVPGGLSYDRTNPDRCYPTAEAAVADGLRASKR